MAGFVVGVIHWIRVGTALLVLTVVASNTILPANTFYSAPLICTNCNRNEPSQKIVRKSFRESFRKLRSSVGLLGAGSVGLKDPCGLQSCPEKFLREPIAYPVKYNTTPQVQFATECFAPMPLVYNLADYYQGFERTQIPSQQVTFEIKDVDRLQTELLRKLNVVSEQLNITGCICFNKTITKNFLIVSPHWQDLSIRAARLSEDLKKSPVELLLTIGNLHRECDILFRQVMILRFELSLIRHKEISTSSNRILRIERNETRPNSQYQLGNLDQPAPLMNLNEATDYLILFEDLVRAVCSQYYLEKTINGSYYTFSPFYYHFDFQNQLEEGLSRQKFIENVFLGLVPENWGTILEQAKPLLVERIGAPPSPSCAPARKMAERVRNLDIPQILPIEAGRSNSDVSGISETRGSVDVSQVPGPIRQLGDQVASLDLRPEASSTRPRFPPSPGVVSSKSPPPNQVAKRQKSLKASTSENAKKPLALPSPGDPK